MIYRISESGHFNISGSGLTAMECAERANLYAAFNLLARDAAKAALQNEKV